MLIAIAEHVHQATKVSNGTATLSHRRYRCDNTEDSVSLRG